VPDGAAASYGAGGGRRALQADRPLPSRASNDFLPFDAADGIAAPACRTAMTALASLVGGIAAGVAKNASLHAGERAEARAPLGRRRAHGVLLRKHWATTWQRPGLADWPALQCAAHPSPSSKSHAQEALARPASQALSVCAHECGPEPGA
jgi:hypothetical protein